MLWALSPNDRADQLRITIDIPDEMHARIKALATKEGTAMRAIIFKGINTILSDKGRPHFEQIRK